MWIAELVEAQTQLTAGETAWVVAVFGLILAAFGYIQLVLADFVGMLRSLQFAAAAQRLFAWTFVVVGLALALVCPWIILVG